MLPKTFFAAFAEKAPLVIFRNQLFQTSPTVQGPHFLAAGRLRFGLVPAECLEQLEEYYRILHEEEILAFKSAYIRERTAQTLLSDNEYSQILGGYMVIKFLLEEVFPLAVADHDVDTLLQAKTAPQDALAADAAQAPSALLPQTTCLIEYKTRRKCCDLCTSSPEQRVPKPPQVLIGSLDQIDELLPASPPPDNSTATATATEDTTYLALVLGKAAILTLLNQVYQLVPSAQPGSLYVHINGTDYQPQPFDTVAAVERRYSTRLKDHFQAEAEDDFNRLQRQGGPLIPPNYAKLLQQDEYVQGEWGFIKKGHDYYATLKVPSYILKDVKHPRRSSYRFPACRVALKVYMAGDQLQCSTGLRVVESYRHPFLSGTNAWGKICMGDFNISELAGHPLPVRVMCLLQYGRKVLTQGYTRSCTPHHTLSSERFRRYKISLMKSLVSRPTNTANQT